MHQQRHKHLSRLGAGLTAAAMLATFAGPATAVSATAVNDAVTAQVGGVAVTGNLLTNDLGAGLTITAIDSLTPGAGTFVVSLATGDYTFTPPAVWYGHLNLNYTISDGSITDIGVVTVTVNAPPTVVRHLATTPENVALGMSSATLRVGSNDPDGNTLTVSGVSNALRGEVVYATGVATFTPTADTCGLAAGGFDYTVSDGFGGSATAHVVVNITCANSTPVLVADTATIDENNPAQLFDVLANDRDPDVNEALTITDLNLFWSYSGTVAIVDNEVQFTPSTLWYGDAIITYTASDGVRTAQTTLTVTVTRDTVAPIVTAPTITWGAGKVGANVPLAVSWTSTDTWTGVKINEAEVKIGAADWAPLYSGPASTFTTTYVFGTTFQWRVRATDNENNASEWVTSALVTAADFQTASTKLTYTGTWRYVATASGSGSGYRYTPYKGGSVSMKFTGRSVAWVAPTNKLSGWVRVYVDGKSVARVNLYSAVTATGKIVFTKSWATNGTHTIKIVNDEVGHRANLDVFVTLR